MQVTKLKPFLTEEQIAIKVKELAAEINKDFGTEHFIAIGILKGAFMFFADLIRHIKAPLSIDFIISSSYVDTSTSGEVTIHSDIRADIAGKDVLLIEDIVDTGISLNKIRERILQKSPKTLKTCVLLDKKDRRIVDVPVDYTGFVIPDEFVIGYGVDYNDSYRNLPYIGILKH
ncbi:MAG: hypoxanthine phosphoribosyltransferase [Nitrospirae bacterium]|nr:hypoxanthine phosphoribosyltransferase [Nitrospirota bacterium]MBF0536252.1 hypoxanthine phosphoribosyltransferase [Nitrospirota bacterium]MBF0615814.1 hypoxanthine phosphoribosyltransferase [Nitrospirota bacterium]